MTTSFVLGGLLVSGNVLFSTVRCRNATSVLELTGLLLWGLKAGHTLNHEKTAMGPPEAAPASPCCHPDIKQLRLGR